MKTVIENVIQFHPVTMILLSSNYKFIELRVITLYVILILTEVVSVDMINYP